ncbi:hypothetical protein EVAR_29393_1 [Eumeta japonica]|uniref:Uncharacterized protein n=1 Tax=Eumeta variegata TaxID=151549 RepID=A0A4C1ZW82_EUMVA|nr:hypothetical protein EVAR_29393_1 [Eumeta japonica]
MDKNGTPASFSKKNGQGLVPCSRSCHKRVLAARNDISFRMQLYAAVKVGYGLSNVEAELAQLFLPKTCGVCLEGRCSDSDVSKRCNLKEDVTTGIEKSGMSSFFAYEICLKRKKVMERVAGASGAKARHLAAVSGPRFV